MSQNFRTFAGCAVLALARISLAHSEESHWPLAPTDADHALGATLGEFQDTDDQVPITFQHAGLDILANPWSGPEDDASAPWVVTTARGLVKWNHADPESLWNSFELESQDGTRYRYLHLAYNSYDPDTAIARRNVDWIESGQLIARVTPWTTGGCDGAYSHLHYDVHDGSYFLNPLRQINEALRPDTQAPEIVRLGLASGRNRDGGWNVIPTEPMKCTVVTDDVEIIAGLRDRDDAGSSQLGTTNIGVHHLRWRVCPDNAPNCAEWSQPQVFERMPIELASSAGNSTTRALFSTNTPWKSDFDECSTAVNETYMVATSAPSEPWSTQDGAYPDGSYTISVEAADVAGNTGDKRILACVQNGSPCIADLVIRDGLGDEGAVPYTGGNVLASPDINLTDGSADNDPHASLTADNVINVRAWNVGSCPLFVGTTYEICLGWRLPSQPRSGPIPAGQLVGCKIELVPSNGWLPGTSRTTSFSWNAEFADTAPVGVALEAWTKLPRDPPQMSFPWTRDNNRAVRIIRFRTSPNR